MSKTFRWDMYIIVQCCMIQMPCAMAMERVSCSHLTSQLVPHLVSYAPFGPVHVHSLYTLHFLQPIQEIAQLLCGALVLQWYLCVLVRIIDDLAFLNFYVQLLC